MRKHESILLEKNGLVEAGVPPNSTSIARAEVLPVDSHSSPPYLKEAILSETPINLNRKETLQVFSKGEKENDRWKIGPEETHREFCYVWKFSWTLKKKKEKKKRERVK